ncbi:MAG: NAD(P)H-dependent oxidoreductase [Oscillospiraceae bacterium]|nr:NAD(P)H-dependent oxidoreductase [Oscillospiraceae bacterium]
MSLTLIYPSQQAHPRLDDVLRHALDDVEHRVVRRPEELCGLAGSRLLFALPVGAYGPDEDYLRLLLHLRAHPDLLTGCTAGLIVDGACELYTKSVATQLALAANLAGCALVGRPLVEATGSLDNFRVQAGALGCEPLQAYHTAAAQLVQRLLSYTPTLKAKPELLTLHASTRHVSNSMDLWEQTRSRLGDAVTVTEIGLRNGTLADCSGCPYTMCLHYGEKGGCFYGGVMQEEVYPAVRRADAILMVCPNYNDALSANLTAFINRLTALFRQMRFYDKALFAIVVSGYSGGDIVARQLISAMNMNKSFHLPGRFALMETANDPGAALSLPGIETRLDTFANNIIETICKKEG